MNFTQVCERSGLDQEAIKFYVSEKLIDPLFPEAHDAESAEYAEEDLLRLDAISNLRRLRFSTEDIRKILYDPSKAAGIVLNHFTWLDNKTKEYNRGLEVLEALDLASFNNPDEVLALLAGLNIDASLPRRDLNRDDEARIRSSMDEISNQNSALHEQLVQAEQQNRKLFFFALMMLFLFVVCVGFIIGPYILW